MLIIFVSDKTVLTAKMSDSTELPETASPTGSSETKSSKKNDQPEFELAASSIPASEYRRYFFSDLQTKPNGKRKQHEGCCKLCQPTSAAPKGKLLTRCDSYDNFRRHVLTAHKTLEVCALCKTNEFNKF